MKSALLLVCLAFALKAQVSGAQTAVLQADAEYRQAVLHSDGTKLAALFADDILIVHSDGTTDTKANFMDAIASARLKLSVYERTGVQVHVYGDVAVMFANTDKTFTYKGSPGKAKDASVVTFLHSGGRWKIIAMQNTPRGE